MKLKNLGYAAFIAARPPPSCLARPEPAKPSQKEDGGAAAAARPVLFEREKPVCAAKGGMKFTYASACYRGEGRRQGGVGQGLPGHESREAAQEGRQEEGQAKPKKKEMKKK